jgi:hypothetical protein
MLFKTLLVGEEHEGGWCLSKIPVKSNFFLRIVSDISLTGGCSAANILLYTIRVTPGIISCDVITPSVKFKTAFGKPVLLAALLWPVEVK